MKNILIPFISLVMVFAMATFNSCAHGGRTQEGVAQDAPGVEGETPSASPDGAPANPEDDLSKQIEAQNLENDLKSLESAEGEKLPAPPAELTQTDGQTPPNTDPTAQGPKTPDTNPEALLDPNAPQGMDVAANNPPAPAPETPSSNVLDTPSTSAAVSAVPKIPTSAKTKNGATLNRFYFVRAGDTTKSVSNLIYGNPNRAKDLRAWNNGLKKWKPGQVVYYQSPSDATDKEMRSFYQENNIPSEEHIVQAGETLSKIAKAKYASANSWKEVAIVNGLTSSGGLEKGQKLALYPSDLKASMNGGEKTEPQVAENEPAPAPKNAQAGIANNAPSQGLESQPISPEPPQGQAPAPSQDLAQAPVTPPPALPEAQPAFENPELKPRKNKNQGLDIGKVIEQNTFAIAMGGLIIVLLLALSALNRKKKARKEEGEGDEVVAMAPRMKRK